MESHRPEAVTKRAERADGGARAACFEQPEGVYFGCVDARLGKYTFVTQSIHDMKLYSEGLFIPRREDA